MEALQNLRDKLGKIVSYDDRDKLGKIVSYDDFFEVRRQIDHHARSSLFHTLWPLAIQRTEDGAAGMAGYMLAELQPDSEHSIEMLLDQVHQSQLDASNRIVPFYLISQFGNHAVQRAASDFIGSLPQGAPRSRVDAVLYWASFPASELCKQFHDWEAREMYGVSDDA